MTMTFDVRAIPGRAHICITKAYPADQICRCAFHSLAVAYSARLLLSCNPQTCGEIVSHSHPVNVYQVLLKLYDGSPPKSGVYGWVSQCPDPNFTSPWTWDLVRQEHLLELRLAYPGRLGVEHISVPCFRLRRIIRYSVLVALFVPAH